MTSSSGSPPPCGACKFLRRKCVRGCVFAPYFCHEQGAAHFAAIHKVFGASNAAKLLSRLPICERGQAAVTISYEAQARLQDPIYGCVSHIHILQQQVVSLQAQLACLKQQASLTNQANPNAKFMNGELFSSSSSSTNSSTAYSYPQDVHSKLYSEYQNENMVMQQFAQNSCFDGKDSHSTFFGNQFHGFVNRNNYDREYNSADLQEEGHGSTTTFQGSSSMPCVEPYYEHKSYSQIWPTDDLHSVAFGHSQIGL